MTSKAIALLGRMVNITGDLDDAYFRDAVADAGSDPVLAHARPFIAEDAIVIDVGANLGALALGFSLMAPTGRVYAFEPMPSAAAFLVLNMVQNDRENLEPLRLALADAPGGLRFQACEGFTAGSHAVTPAADAAGALHAGTTITVPCTTLDHFVAERALTRVDFIKIDVEGAELRVLEGARETLARFKPTVIVEFNSYTLIAHEALLPTVALKRIGELFTFVGAISRADHVAGVAPLARDFERSAFMHRNLTGGCVDNLICSSADGFAERVAAEWPRR